MSNKQFKREISEHDSGSLARGLLCMGLQWKAFYSFTKNIKPANHIAPDQGLAFTFTFCGQVQDPSANPGHTIKQVEPLSKSQDSAAIPQMDRSLDTASSGL